MLPRGLRLSRRTFQGTLRGKTTTNKHLSLVWGPSKEGGCAVVVSKKVASSSVARHLLKRRILALMRPHCSTSRFLVMYAKKEAPTLSFKTLSSEVKQLLAQVPSPTK